MIIEFPDRREREKDEALLAVIGELEAMGIRVIEANLLDQFIAPVSEGERRAFNLIAGVS